MARVPIPMYGQRPRKGMSTFRVPAATKPKKPAAAAASPAGYGAPADILAAQRIAATMTDPIVKQIQSAIDAKAKAGMGAIGGYTNQLGQVLGGLAARSGDPYRQAQQGQAASDAALLQAVSGAGQDQAQQLAAKLAQIGAPQAAVDQTAGLVGANAQGSGGALYGQGSASLSELLGREASARDYAGKQVGIGAMTGLQTGRELLLSSQKELADQVGQVKAQIPDVVSSALTRINDSREQKRRDELNYQIAVQSGLVKDRDSQRDATDKSLDRASRERIASEKAAAAAASKQATRDDKRQAAAEKRSAAKAEARTKAFYSARSGAFKDAAAAFGAGRTAAQVTSALRAKYGQLLRGYGYDEKAISRMIGNAVKAGKATPYVPGKPSSGSSSGSLVP